jgi:hypothetical protein
MDARPVNDVDVILILQGKVRRSHQTIVSMGGCRDDLEHHMKRAMKRGG